ncbi:hypothetical protein SLA2020_513790 [Shorea laevis]
MIREKRTKEDRRCFGGKRQGKEGSFFYLFQSFLKDCLETDAVLLGSQTVQSKQIRSNSNNNLCFNRSSNFSSIRLRHWTLQLKFSSAKEKIFRTSSSYFNPVKWSKPPLGWMKLSSDGSAFSNPGNAGAAVVIRDGRGNWVVGYAKKLGMGSNNMAELWDI